jgi:tetratricopeptide (TPR) repeat protein
MKKILMTLAAVFCCAMTTTVDAQDKVEQALKQAEQKAKLADENVENGKMQYEAAVSFISDDLGEKKDLDRALTYANRAFKISQERPAPQDTLKGLTCYALGMIYMWKQSWENCFDYLEMAMDAFQEELGRYDPVTNGTKLVYGYFMAGAQPLRAFPMIQEAFTDNSMTPQDKRIENMDMAFIAQSMALEMLIAEYTKRMSRAVPMIIRDGKSYLVVQTKDWNMERPLVGWMAPAMLRTEAENKVFKGDDLIICDENFKLIVVPEEEKDQYMINFNYIHQIRNPRQIQIKDGSSAIWFLNDQSYNDILNKYRELMSKKK